MIGIGDRSSILLLNAASAIVCVTVPRRSHGCQTRVTDCGAADPQQPARAAWQRSSPSPIHVTLPIHGTCTNLFSKLSREEIDRVMNTGPGAEPSSVPGWDGEAMDLDPLGAGRTWMRGYRGEKGCA